MASIQINDSPITYEGDFALGATEQVSGLPYMKQSGQIAFFAPSLSSEYVVNAGDIINDFWRVTSVEECDKWYCVNVTRTQLIKPCSITLVEIKQGFNPNQKLELSDQHTNILASVVFSGGVSTEQDDAIWPRDTYLWVAAQWPEEVRPQRHAIWDGGYWYAITSIRNTGKFDELPVVVTTRSRSKRL